jgi:hypothetical protein
MMEYNRWQMHTTLSPEQTLKYMLHTALILPARVFVKKLVAQESEMYAVIFSVLHHSLTSCNMVIMTDA